LCGGWFNHLSGNFFRSCWFDGSRSGFSERQHALRRSRRGGNRLRFDRLSGGWCGNRQVHSSRLHWSSSKRSGFDRRRSGRGCNWRRSDCFSNYRRFNRCSCGSLRGSTFGSGRAGSFGRSRLNGDGSRCSG
jgi:hypothetical protein